MEGKIGSSTTHHTLFHGIISPKLEKEGLIMLNHLKRFSESEVASERLRIIEFYKQYGGLATFDAYGVTRQVISIWNKKIVKGQGRLDSLIPGSTTPIKQRQMTTDPLILSEIKRLRLAHYRLGKEKIKVFLDDYCLVSGLTPISVSTIGKIIKRNKLYYSKSNYRIYHIPKDQENINNKRNKKKRLRIKHSPQYTDLGHIQCDTVERIMDGIKYYFFDALDISGKFGLSLKYKTLTSKNMVDFYQLFKIVYPFIIKDWQSDNGHENLGMFDQRLTIEGIPHFFTYPRCPKINGVVERFNRTIQEEFIDQNLDIIHNEVEFNTRLADWNI